MPEDISITKRQLESNPRVSIGMPVFNGERYIREAIDSILSQTFSDFELIISDNASTDKTQEICKDYASLDGRIRYYRNLKNLGASKNFNRVFELSAGEYFKWAAHDDTIERNFLTECVAILDNDPSLVLCHSKVKIIDEYGNLLSDSYLNLNKVSSIKPHERLRDLTRIKHACYHVFGLIRSNVLKNTMLISNYLASDRVLLANLSLFGRFYEIPEFLFCSREHSERSVRALPLHLRGAWFDTSKTAPRVVFPYWRTYLEFFKCVKRSSMKSSERMRCYRDLMLWPFLNMHWLWLGTDLVFAAIPGTSNLFWNLKRLKQKHLAKK